MIYLFWPRWVIERRWVFVIVIGIFRIVPILKEGGADDHPLSDDGGPLFVIFVIFP